MPIGAKTGLCCQSCISTSRTSRPTAVDAGVPRPWMRCKSSLSRGAENVSTSSTPSDGASAVRLRAGPSAPCSTPRTRRSNGSAKADCTPSMKRSGVTVSVSGIDAAASSVPAVIAAATARPRGSSTGGAIDQARSSAGSTCRRADAVVAARCSRRSRAGCQLPQGLLTLEDLARIGRDFQPASERGLAGLRSRKRQQLEERGRPEQVEVGFVGMPLVVECLASRAQAGPTVFDARETVFVERDGRRGAIARAQDAVVPHGKSQKRHGGDSEPPR